VVKFADTAMLDLWLPYPPSANLIWRAVPKRGVLLSKVGRQYRKRALDAISSSLSIELGYDYTEPIFHADTRLAVVLEAFPPDRRARRDIDNIPKAIHDALTIAQVWDDDSQVDWLTIRRREVVRSSDPAVKGAIHARICPVDLCGVMEAMTNPCDPPSSHALELLAGKVFRKSA